MRTFFICFMVAISLSNALAAQCVSYDLTSTGDTLNCTDIKNFKQGKWKIAVPALRSEPAYDEEGIFINNLKEGVWRRYNTDGMLIAIEQYKWGYKNGVQKYIEEGRLEHEESWLMLDPKKKFDTVDVYDIYQKNKVTQQIVPVLPYAVKHGTWKYYDLSTGKLERKENYILGKIAEPTKPVVNTTTQPTTDTVAKPKIVPKAVLEFEKKNKGKKNAIRDGRTG